MARTHTRAVLYLRDSRYVLPVSQVSVAMSGGRFVYYPSLSCPTATSKCAAGLVPFNNIAFLVVPLTPASMVNFSITDGAYRAPWDGIGALAARTL